MLLILAASLSNRLRYITDLMLREMLGLDFRLTTSREDFSGHHGPKITYSKEPFADGLFIEATGMLFETVIVPQKVTISTTDGIPVLFETANPQSALPFDPFAACFYMVARYEEYLPHKKDRFGRYLATESIASKGNFLDMPIVHRWVDMLERLLRKHFPGLGIRHPQFRFVPTIDIDHAWCYRQRTLARTLGGFARSLIHGDLHEIAERFKVLALSAPDPYHNYSFIQSLHGRYGNQPVYFILFANYGHDDNNVTVTSKAFHKLIKELDQHGGVGIHPSLLSNTQREKLENEFSGLNRVLGRQVTISRQHFLKLTMPETYRNLVQLGIQHDYSMGYATHSGFRAGIAIPFRFFDLMKDETTKLIIHPVALMDVTMKDYLRLSKVESLDKITSMVKTFRNAHGEFVSLWHNESLGGTGRWAGWQEVYEEMVKMAST